MVKVTVQASDFLKCAGRFSFGSLVLKTTEHSRIDTLPDRETRFGLDYRNITLNLSSIKKIKPVSTWSDSEKINLVLGRR